MVEGVSIARTECDGRASAQKQPNTGAGDGAAKAGAGRRDCADGSYEVSDGDGQCISDRRAIEPGGVWNSLPQPIALHVAEWFGRGFVCARYMGSKSAGD